MTFPSATTVSPGYASLRPRTWARFIQKLEKHSIPEPNSGCVLWTGHVTRKGYGRVRHQKKSWYVHRLSWIVHRGPIPLGLNVCHKCDVPSCINPDHFFLGTHTENHADMMRKGRHRVRPRLGEENGQSKIDARAVVDIRVSPASGAALARALGVSETTISRIRSGKLWGHI